MTIRTKTKENNNNNKSDSKWTPGTPGKWAVCRYQVNGYWHAASLLFWIKWRWKKKNKMQRWNKEWIVASADEWAKESGLSQGEYKNQALPILKKLGIIDVKTWKLKGTRKTWIHLNVDALDNTYDTFFEFYEMRREDNFHDDTILGSNNHNTYAKIRKKPPKKKK